MVETIPSIPVRIRTGLKLGWRTSSKLLCIILPFYVAVQLFKDSPIVVHVANYFVPLMDLFGLPGEAAFALVIGGLLNIYAAIAILATLNLDPWQVTQCGLMLGLAHELVIEGGVMRSTGMRAIFFTLMRVAMAVVCGILYFWYHQLAGAA